MRDLQWCPSSSPKGRVKLLFIAQPSAKNIHCQKFQLLFLSNCFPRLSPFDPSKLFLELDVPHCSLSPDTFPSLADPGNVSSLPAHSTHLELVTSPTQACISPLAKQWHFVQQKTESVVGHNAQIGAGDSAGRRGGCGSFVDELW